MKEHDLCNPLVRTYYIRALVREAGARPGLVRRARREARDGGRARIWCPLRDMEGVLTLLVSQGAVRGAESL